MMNEWSRFLAELDWQKLTSTALFAGLVAILATVAIERFGGKLGGVLATLPTTIIPASLGFWYLSESNEDFIVAMWSVPIGMLLDAAFLHSWRWIPPIMTMNNPMLRLAGVVLGTLSFWFVLAFVVVTALQDFLGYIYWFGGGALLFQVGYGVYASPGGGSKASEAKRVPWLTLLLRGVMAGTAIAIATWIIAVGHPVFAGVASVFPAIFLTIMVSVWVSQGPQAQAHAVGPMMLGSTSVSVYALVATWTFPIFGPLLGTVIAWCIAVGGVSVPSAVFLRRSTA
ncbi:MAG: hypothetical protein ACPGQS_01470 [Bradymonadia bacterium]